MGWFTGSSEKEERSVLCFFCNKNYRDGGMLVAGANSVLICASCVLLCHGILQEEQARRQGKIRAFLVAGATYRFTTDTGSWVGVVRARLEPPHEHWVQVEAVGADGAAASEPTWINLTTRVHRL